MCPPKNPLANSLYVNVEEVCEWTTEYVFTISHDVQHTFVCV